MPDVPAPPPMTNAVLKADMAPSDRVLSLYFRLRCESEIMHVVGYKPRRNQQRELFVLRGQEGTTAAEHPRHAEVVAADPL